MLNLMTGGHTLRDIRIITRILEIGIKEESEIQQVVNLINGNPSIFEEAPSIESILDLLHFLHR